MNTEHELREAILGYLIQNPDAKDTLEGIARFWIPRQTTTALVESVALALQELVDLGYVVERTIDTGGGGRGPRCFELDRRHLSEIADLLKRSGRSADRRCED